MKKVLFWPYKFKDMKESWQKQTIWIAKVMEEEGYKVLRHPKFVCKGLNCDVYDWKKDRLLDIVIYNHADISHLKGNIAKSKLNLFMKPTVPTKYHTTLDTLGYGPFSSVTYSKPDFEKVSKKEVNKFFKTKVKNWINNKANKWGDYFKTKNQKVNFKDFYLVIGQCAGDEVVTRHDFGNYINKLESIVRELARVGDKTIIVKLHPYMDGKIAKNNNYSKTIGMKLAKISKKVKVFLGKSNIHAFLEKANCIFLANSGAGIETMMHHKPIISWGYPEYHWTTYDLRHLADLSRAIKLDWFNQEKQDKFLYWYTEKHCFYNQETARRRVGELIK